MLGFDDLTLGTLIHLALAIVICSHILLTKDSESVAMGWMALVILMPFVGSLLYWLFGVNRLALYMRDARGTDHRIVPREQASTPQQKGPQDAFLHYGCGVHEAPYVAGNDIQMLINGETAYPAMLDAIARAAHSIAVSVYIFDYDAVGKRFMDALIAAHERGVTVRVIVDDIGLLYSRRAVDRVLRKAGIATTRFAPRSLKFMRFINLRNHRKLLIVDGREAFMGGMNIRQVHVVSSDVRAPVQDIHFRICGPVVDQASVVFEKDWNFAAGEIAALPRWQAGRADSGNVLARIVPDGPDDYYEKTEWLILGALANSRRTIRIMTPYFLPNRVLSRALVVAALRGVAVEVLIPARSNLPFIDWAMEARFQQLMEQGVRIYRSAPPFDHSKLLVVDGAWFLVGSSNWDQRSLRLNFEANLEGYDVNFAGRLEAYFTQKKAQGQPVNLDQVKNLSLAARIRNNLTNLFSPYL